MWSQTACIMCRKALGERIPDCILSSPTVISSCDPDYVALYRLAVRDAADPTAHTLLLTLCSRQTKTALCWCNKRQLRRSNTCAGGTPPLEARGKLPPKKTLVYVCACSVRICFVRLLMMNHFVSDLKHTSCSLRPMWAPQSVSLPPSG